MLTTLMIAVAVMLSPATGTVQQELTPAGEQYGEVWQWCGERFPAQDELVAACRWGAYEMLPADAVPTEEWRA